MRKKKVVLVIIILILIAILAYFIFFYKQTCKDESCFANAMSKCSKASFVSDDEEASWSYNIKNKKAGECIVNVKILQAKQGNVELEKIQGLSMDCGLPLSYTGSPQQDLTRCHGLLKESLQELMIQKMHAYILSNLGKIDEALKTPL